MVENYPSLLNLLIDRLSVVVYIECAEEYRNIYTILWNLFEDREARTWRTKYHTKSEIKLGDNARLNVWIGRTHGRNYAKFDWSPNKLTDRSSVNFYVLLRSMLPDGYRTLFERGLVTYIEVAADFSNIAVEELFVFEDTLVNTSIWPHYPEPTETIYVGHRKHSQRVFCVYNKALELRKNGIQTEGELTRIESRLRYCGLNLFELKQLKNPFLSLRICSKIESLRLFPSISWRDFMVECEREGAHAALQKCPWASRRKRMSYLSRAHCNWWAPLDVWPHWDSALEILVPRPEFEI